VSFAELRQTCLQNGPLSTAQFGQERTFTRSGGSPQTVRVKLASERQGMRTGGRTVGQVIKRGTIDEAERLEVTFSRDSSWAYGLAAPPSPGDTLAAAASDPDQRPYAFTGEVLGLDDQHGKYVFSRVRRYVQGGHGA
jgi:hypothetical protein